MKISRTAWSLAVATALCGAGRAPGSAQQPAAAGAPRAAQGGGGSRADSLAFADYTGWTKIWDGSTFSGWSGNMSTWKIVSGAITATSTCESPTGTTYLIWQGGQPGDFELKVDVRMEGPSINGGIQYRSVQRAPNAPAAPAGGAAAAGGGGAGQSQSACPGGGPRGQAPAAANAPFNVQGPQMDFSGDNGWTGQYYQSGAAPRFIEASRGQVVEATPGKTTLIASLGDTEELAGFVNVGNWNQVHIIARGNTVIHMVNGHIFAIFMDNDPERFRSSGVLALQIESTGTVSYRNIYLKQ